MNLSTPFSKTLFALCPVAALALASSATAFDWWGQSSPLSAPTLGGIVVGNPADLPEEETDSFMDPTSNDLPTIESVLNAWGTSTGNADLDAEFQVVVVQRRQAEMAGAHAQAIGAVVERRQ